MKKLLPIILFFFCFNLFKAQPPAFAWAGRYGWVNSEGGNAITVDAAGNSYSTGYFYGTLDFDPGPGVYNVSSVGGWDVFILKLDAAGNFVWVKAFSGPQNEVAYGIALDNAGFIYTAGYFGATCDFDPGLAQYNLTSAGMIDIFVSKLDPSGNFVWAKRIGKTAGEDAVALTLDPSANVYVCGQFSDTIDFDPGVGTYTLGTKTPGTSYILKLDSAGNFGWAGALQSKGSVEPLSLAADANNNVFVTGYFDSIMDFDPGPGTFTLSPVKRDAYVLRLNANGSFVWAKQISGPYWKYGRSIAVDAASNSYITGEFASTVDFDPGPGTYTMSTSFNGTSYILKLDALGNFVWAISLNGYQDVGLGITLDAAGNVYSAGYLGWMADFDPGPGTYTISTIGTNNGAYIWKLDPGGNFVWARQISGGSGSAYAKALAVSASGGVYTIGTFDGTCDFDPGPATYTLAGIGTDDFFIQKMNQSTVDVAELKENSQLTIFPNPTSGILSIIGKNNILYIKVLNTLGEVIDEQIIYNSNIVSLDVSKESSGIYFVEVQTNAGVIRSKFVKN